MEFLAQYGMFLLKSFTLVFAIIFLFAGIFAVGKKPKPKVTIENPICDSVLKATTFFKSSSTKLANLEKNIVNKPIIRTKLIKFFCKTRLLKFINKIRPAVTKVLLWTKDLTGVGALIALGNQDLNGNCALLVKAVNKSNNDI